jgi:hypothetical protein
MKNAVKYTEPAEFPGIRVGEIAYKSGTVKPFAIAANQNDYDTLKASIARFAPSVANLVLTGIVAPASEWKRLMLINYSAFHLTLSDQDALSVAANRFDCGGTSYVLQAKRAVELIYDQTAKRWLVMANEATFAS